MTNFKVKDLMISIFAESEEMVGEIGACGPCTCSCASCGTCTCSCGTCGTCTITHAQWRSVPDSESNPGHKPKPPSLKLDSFKADLNKLESQ